jgi:hypothetical protein
VVGSTCRKQMSEPSTTKSCISLADEHATRDNGSLRHSSRQSTIRMFSALAPLSSLSSIPS